MRLEQLTEAIKRVYASTFSGHAKAYVRATPYRLEEEKMAVVLQQVVGATHGTRFYPDCSGVVRSRNFIRGSREGRRRICRGGVRAGKNGGRWRQSIGLLSALPAAPGPVLVGGRYSDKFANRVLGARPGGVQHADPADDLREVSFDLAAAEADGTLQMLASTYSADNHAVYDGLGREARGW